MTADELKKNISDELIKSVMLSNDERIKSLDNLSFMLHEVSDDVLPDWEKELIHDIFKNLISELTGVPIVDDEDLEISIFMGDLDQQLEGFDELNNELDELLNLN
jgi:hypothetical protein